MSTNLPRALLALILLLYLALGTLFAVKTPAWQAPDEPAHYNYVRYLATNGDFPVLHMGDYPHDYLEEIKAAGFPPGMSIDPIRYEFHQPPLYYALVAPLYSLTNGNLLALRLFSVLLGAGIVILAYVITRRVFPGRPALALGTAAFVAFLPQHLATISQVGNDVLAELLFAAVLYVLVGWALGIGARDRGSGAGDRGSGDRGQGKGGREQESSSFQFPASNLQPPISNLQLPAFIFLGILVGLILITKTTAYIAVPLAGGVLVWRWWRKQVSFRHVLREGFAVVLPAALLALPWYGRDIWTYGWPDFLGLIRHNAIVIGQPRTIDWLAQYGWGGYLQRLIEFTFKSFWGVFGWLGVFMDSRVYFALAVLSGIAFAGLVMRGAWYVVRKSGSGATSDQHATRNTQYAIQLLAITVLLALLVYAWYNLQFVQHQGRYLFTALIPIAIFFSVGWKVALRPHASRWLAAILVVFGAALVAWSLLAGHGLSKWPLAIAAAFAGALVVASYLPDRLRRLAFAVPFALLPVLALYALFGAVVPQLAG